MSKQSLGNGYFKNTVSQILLMGMMLYGLEYCLGQFSSAAPAVSPPSLLLNPNPMRYPNGKNRKSWCCASTVQHQIKHLHAINTVLVTNPKPSTAPAARRRIRSVTVRPSARSLLYTSSIGCCYTAGHGTRHPSCLGSLMLWAKHGWN